MDAYHQSEGHCFQRVASLFSPCYLFLKKLPKSLILHGNCPSLRNSLPVFLENVALRAGTRIVTTFARVALEPARRGAS